MGDRAPDDGALWSAGADRPAGTGRGKRRQRRGGSVRCGGRAGQSRAVGAVGSVRPGAVGLGVGGHTAYRQPAHSLLRTDQRHAVAAVQL